MVSKSNRHRRSSRLESTITWLSSWKAHNSWTYPTWWYDVTPSMKNLALKAKKHQKSSSEDEKSDDEEDLFALITRGLKGIWRCTKELKILNLETKANLRVLIPKLTKRKRNITRKTKRNKQWLLSGVIPKDQRIWKWRWSSSLVSNG